MAQSYSVFISAVTREFGAARDAVANALQARGIDVKVQRSFDLGDDTTLAKLHDYIRGCDRVIAVIGAYSGMFPPQGAVTDEFRAMLPGGMNRASITQWEVIFARHYGRQTYFFEAVGYAPEQTASERDDGVAQAEWRDWLFDGGIGRDRRQFHNAEGLRADVMELKWSDLARPKPSNLPGSIGHLFKGRQEFLERLHESFRHTPAAAIIGKAVHGLGGVGKTRTAIEYGHAYGDEYTATLFLIGKSEIDLMDSLAVLAGEVLDLPEKDSPDLQTRVAAVVHWLRANPGWLVIIDNVDNEPAAGAARAFLDQVGRGAGHLVVTSRLSDWAHIVSPLELDLLSLDAAKELLRDSTPHRTKSDDEDATLDRLVEEQLGCLSLALVQAAAYIDERRLGFADYAQQFDQEAAKLLAKLGEAAVRNLGYPLPVALTWHASVAQLSEAGKLLLDMLAWLSIEPIPRSLFDAWPEADSVDLNEGLTDLTRYNLVHWETENSAITLHRLVAQVTRDNLDDAARRRTLGALFPWLIAVNPKIPANDIRCWPQLLPLLPHALLLFQRTKDLGPYPGQASLYSEYATLLQSLARYAEAEPLCRQAIALDEKVLGPNHPRVAARLSNLAVLLRATARVSEAETLYRRAIQIDEESQGPDHPELAVHINNLAVLLHGARRLAEAEPLYRRALTIDETAHGPNHPKVAIRLSNLAGLLGMTDRTDEAEPLHRRALAIDEAFYGPDHPETANDLTNLAGLLHESDRFPEAEPLYRRALAIDEASLGPSHPKVAIDLNNLAGLLSATGREAEGSLLYQRAAQIFLRSSKASGHLLPQTRPALRNYGLALIELGRQPKDARGDLAKIMFEAGFDPAELWPQVFDEPFDEPYA